MNSITSNHALALFNIKISKIEFFFVILFLKIEFTMNFSSQKFARTYYHICTLAQKVTRFPAVVEELYKSNTLHDKALGLGTWPLLP